MKVIRGVKIQHNFLECKIRSEGFFCDIGESNLKIFESLKISNAYPKGTTLFMEGQPSNGIYMLCQGRVKLSTSSKDGKVLILHIAEPGEILGLSAAVSDSIHTTTAEILEPTQVNFVKNEDFLSFLQENTAASFSALKQLSHKYSRAYLQVRSLGLSNSVADKLAKLFLSWCKRHPNKKENVHLKMPYTHEEIAGMIGTSRETVTRALKDFKQKKLISLKGSDLIIHHKEKLSGESHIYDSPSPCGS